MPSLKTRFLQLFVVALLTAIAIHWTISAGQTTPDSVAATVPLLKQLETYDITTDSSGNVVSLTLRQEFSNDQNLMIVNGFASLQRLVLMPVKSNRLTEQGIASLGGLTNLVALQLNCGATLPDGVFQGVCNLRQLQYLGLTAACPPLAELNSITNLGNLVELRVIECPNFADHQLAGVTNLTKLRSLVLYGTNLSKGATNILHTMTSLTNVDVRVR